MHAEYNREIDSSICELYFQLLKLDAIDQFAVDREG